jgi:hypothetical protein
MFNQSKKLNLPLLQTISLFDGVVAQAWFAAIVCARFQNIEIIEQVLDFRSDACKLLALVFNRPRYLNQLSHKRSFDFQLCGL